MSDETFVPRGVREEPVKVLPRREARTAHIVFRAVDGFEVAIPERLLSRAIAIGRSHAPLEWLGQLVGSRYRDEEGAHVVIDAVVRDVDARAEPHFVTSTIASEGRTRALAREQYPDAVVVGWIHGHIRHGAHYSRHDFTNQATWTDPDSIGIVVDPWDPKRLAVYRGPRGERLTLVANGKERVRRVSESPSPEPTATPSKRRGKGRQGWSMTLRACAIWLLSEVASYTTGAWMGRVEARIRAFEHRQADAARAIARVVGARDRGGFTPARARGAEDLFCLAPIVSHGERSTARNVHPQARMKRRDRTH